VKPAFQKDDAFLDDVSKVIKAGETCLWWLGQSGFLIVQNRRGILLDPYLSDTLTLKYANTDKPHVRITEQVVHPAMLGILDLDLVSSSHNHTDHFDPETLEALLISEPDFSLIVPAANRDVSIERLGERFSSRLRFLDHGATLTIGDIEIHGIAAAHNTVERDEKSHCRFLGYVIR